MTKAIDATERGRKRLTQALVQLVLRHAFDAAIIMRLRRSEDVSMPFPMATDGLRLLVNPARLAELSTNEITVVLKHEARHVAGLHPLRQEWRTDMVLTEDGVAVTLWNIACDRVVNHQLEGMEALKLPAGCVPGVADTTPEAEYLKLQKMASKLPKLALGAAMLGDLRPPTHDNGAPLTQTERQALAQQTKQWIEAAAVAAKQAGQLSADLERLVKLALRSVVPWREVLARFVSDKRLADYSWQRPNRRFVSYGVYLPKLEARDVPRVAFFGDASGSISPKMMEEVAAEAFAVLELMSDGEPVEMPFGWFDTQVYMQYISSPADISPRGGGGTDYAPVMAWLREHHDAQDFKGAVVVTDGHCESWGEQPPCEVLWVLTNEHNESFAPPFGEVALVLEERNDKHS
jgi:predicted metal-dependent peptidase